MTVAYFALIAADRAPLAPGSDASAARGGRLPSTRHWPSTHKRIVGYAVERLRNKAARQAELPPKMDLPDILTPLKELSREGASRPARLYTFSPGRFEKLKDRGIIFPF